MTFFFPIMASLSFALGSQCPELTGTYTRTANNKMMFVKIQTQFDSGAATYLLQTGEQKTTWSWTSTADGKTYPKTITDQYVNFEEVATCVNQKLHRSLTGDWINDGLEPFDLETDLYLSDPKTLHWFSDFTGWGLNHEANDDIYERTGSPQ